jgi:uncharacterized protein
MQSFTITKEQLAHYLVAYHHLTEQTAMTKDQIVEYVRKVGCIQYDPLDVVGRNPDLVLQSRCPDYIRGDINTYLYQERSLFDVWDKCMSISTVEDWPYFSRFRQKYLAWCEQYADVVQQITEYLLEHDSACSSDFALEDRVDWHYGPQRLAKAALECMCYAGLAVVHHKKGTRRYYGLAKRYIPDQLYAASDPNQTSEEYAQWLVLRRMNSVGALWNRPSDAFLGASDFKSAHRNGGFAGLLQDGKIVEIQVEGMKHSVYIAKENINLLEKVVENPESSSTIRFLAPLDNMLWDRKLIAEVFGFEYKWEVYTPAEQRKYGYYVLPILCGHKLIGRIEFSTDKKTKTLQVKSLWWEDRIQSPELYQEELVQAIHRLATYNQCATIDIRV